MQDMGITSEMARQILDDELMMYKANRYRLTMRAKVLKRVGTDEATGRALIDELEKIEQIISEFETEIEGLDDR